MGCPRNEITNSSREVSMCRNCPLIVHDIQNYRGIENTGKIQCIVIVALSTCPVPIQVIVTSSRPL